MTVMVWYSQGGGYMLCDSEGMVQSRWGGTCCVTVMVS